MKITVYGWEDSDYCYHEEMYVDGKHKFGVHPLYRCPEDAVIGRDLIGISEWMQFAMELVEATKAGEDVSVEFIDGMPEGF